MINFLYKQDFVICVFELLAITLSPIALLKNTQSTVVETYCTNNLGAVYIWSVQAKKNLT